MKQYLLNVIESKNAEMKELRAKSDVSEDIKEVRAIGETLAKLAEEIAAAEKQLAELENNKDEENKQPEEERSVIPANATLKNVVARFNVGKNEGLEYRNAFMNNVLRNVPIPAELRADENTLTTDITVIPTELVNQIVEKMDNVGMLLPFVTKTAYKGGVSVPVSTVKPVATWVAEGAGSDRQKKTTGSINFQYYKLRCEISMSMEVGVMALSAFEAKFVENVSKAMVYAIENAIINGTGVGQPKGILTETATATIEVKGDIKFNHLTEAEGVLPEQYETGAKWIMNKKTFAKVQGMVDLQGQPIARVNFGLNGKLERLINGREVVVAPYVADDKMIMFDLSDYLLNTVYDMGISKMQDWDTEDLLTKAVMSVDGKAVDNGSLVVVNIAPATV